MRAIKRKWDLHTMYEDKGEIIFFSQSLRFKHFTNR